MADQAAIESARLEWADAEDALEREPDAERRRALWDQVEVVTAELRRRLGQTYTVAELADAYADGDRWAHAVLSDADVPAWWPRTISTVQAAAFGRYALGAVDYAP